MNSPVVFIRLKPQCLQIESSLSQCPQSLPVYASLSQCHLNIQALETVTDEESQQKEWRDQLFESQHFSHINGCSLISRNIRICVKNEKIQVLIHVFLRKRIGVWYRLTPHFLSSETACPLGFIHRCVSALRGATHVLVFFLNQPVLSDERCTAS